MRAGLRFVGAGPGRRGIAEKSQRLFARRAELEIPTRGDYQGVSRRDRTRFNALRFRAGRAAPHLALTLEEIPDLFNLAMPDGPRDLVWAERRLAQAGCGCALSFTDQQPDLRTVRCLVGGF